LAAASGSGCAPPGDTLPDGDWFGFIEGIDTTGDPRLTFDLACYFDPPEDNIAAAEDGRAVPVEFTPYIRNQNPKVFELTVAPGAVVDEFFSIVAFNVWVVSIPAENGCSPATGYRACPVWVEISGGAVVMLYGFLPEWAGDGRGP